MYAYTVFINRECHFLWICFFRAKYIFSQKIRYFQKGPMFTSQNSRSFDKVPKSSISFILKTFLLCSYSVLCLQQKSIFGCRVCIALFQCYSPSSRVLIDYKPRENFLKDFPRDNPPNTLHLLLPYPTPPPHHPVTQHPNPLLPYPLYPTPPPSIPHPTTLSLIMLSHIIRVQMHKKNTI